MQLLHAPRGSAERILLTYRDGVVMHEVIVAGHPREIAPFRPLLVE